MSSAEWVVLRVFSPSLTLRAGRQTGQTKAKGLVIDVIRAAATSIQEITAA